VQTPWTYLPARFNPRIPSGSLTYNLHGPMLRWVHWGLLLLLVVLYCSLWVGIYHFGLPLFQAACSPTT
jgi:hypothetical protein